MKDIAYLTTTIPYVNSDPHIGFALEIVQADIIARHKRLAGGDVLLNTGTDEHGVKIYRKALEKGVTPQAYTDEYAEKFRKLRVPLGIVEDVNFIRTTDPHHIESAQEFWRRCDLAGDIYKKNYKIKYCVGCELEKTDSELAEGKCPVHPNLSLEIIEEENYFFKLSKYTDHLLKLFEKKGFVVPDFRLNEIRSLISEKGLEDFSVSRLKEKMPWGVPVPNDDRHVMYVWFDAFVNYISAIGWPDDMKKFEKWWPVTQFAGKDQVRQQAVMWQAMLMSVGLPSSGQIVIHGFITSGGEKMSKSLGNVVDPLAIVAEYGTDALRYYLARHIHPFEDSDFTIERFKEAYNADLANGLGNLVSRVMKMAVAYEAWPNLSGAEDYARDSAKKRAEYLDIYEFQKFMTGVLDRVKTADGVIATEEPFRQFKVDAEKARETVRNLVETVFSISFDIEPVMPETAKTVRTMILERKMPGKPLFPRKL